MGVQTELVIADLDEAVSIAESDEPSRDWDGFPCNGFDNVKLCTLLSILETGSPEQTFEAYLDRIKDLVDTGEEGPSVMGVPADAVELLATIAGFEPDEFERCLDTWARTEEFEGWGRDEVSTLLLSVGDLAETASLQAKCLLLSIRL